MFGYPERQTAFERAVQALRGHYWTPAEAEELVKLVEIGTRRK